MMKVIYFCLLGLFLITTSCNKSNSNNSSTATSYYWNGNSCYASPSGQLVASTYCSASCANTATAGYYWNGNYCYSANGQMVANTYCQTTATTNSTCGTNTGYYTTNGYCYSSTTGQMVDNTYCTTMNNGGIVSMQCNGQFYYNNQPVTCGYGGYNCAGNTLTEISTNRQVQCL